MYDPSRTVGRAPRIRWGARLALLFVFIFGCDVASSSPEGLALQAARSGPARGDVAVVVAWNELAYHTAYAEDQFLTFKGQRAIAMMNLAIHDALNTISPAYERYAYGGARVAGADATTAAAQAAHDVLISQYADARTRLDSALAHWLTRAEGASPRERGVALGAEAATAVVAARDGDGWDFEGSYEFGSGPGRYKTTPDWNGFVLQPGFRAARPFAIGSVEEWRPPPPPGLIDAAYTDAFDEVKAFGAAGSTVRTPDQTSYAVWWMEFAEGSVNRLARRLVTERRMGMWEATRMFAHMHVALFDTYIATWDSKYEYDHWRPYTAIREAVTDGNAATESDAVWESLRPAPPFPEYVSAHAAGCAAAFAVLASAFGDGPRFTMTTITAPPDMPSRSFSTYGAAADECADSRVQLGWHFRYSTDAGLALGRGIAAHVTEGLLRRH